MFVQASISPYTCVPVLVFSSVFVSRRLILLFLPPWCWFYHDRLSCPPPSWFWESKLSFSCLHRKLLFYLAYLAISSNSYPSIHPSVQPPTHPLCQMFLYTLACPLGGCGRHGHLELIGTQETLHQKGGASQLLGPRTHQQPEVAILMNDSEKCSERPTASGPQDGERMVPR